MYKIEIFRKKINLLAQVLKTICAKTPSQATNIETINQNDYMNDIDVKNFSLLANQVVTSRSGSFARR
jgi:hypothetical protein